MSKDFEKVTQESVENIYTTFVSRVANGRNLTTSKVDSIGQGRVWTGTEALQIGLVDQLGSLEDAVEVAAELAEVSDYRTTDYPRYKTDFKDSFKPFSFVKLSKEEILKEELGVENYTIYKNLKHFSQLKGIQARMPFIMEIK
jgi:protease-4